MNVNRRAILFSGLLGETVSGTLAAAETRVPAEV